MELCLLFIVMKQIFYIIGILLLHYGLFITLSANFGVTLSGAYFVTSLGDFVTL